MKNTDNSNDGNPEGVDDAEKPLDLDDVLANEIGQFGYFQLRNIILVFIPIIMSSFMNEYIFSAAAIPHRCQIPECGEEDMFQKYEQDWISNAAPRSGIGISSCQRYAPHGDSIFGSIEYCPANLFDTNKTIACEGYVYSKNNSVVYDFDLGCQDWLRALAGTLNSAGILLAMPITGYISDRFGRKLALVINVFNLSLFGLIRAFSTNYTMYLILQIVQTTLGAGTFSSAYIFAAELVGPKYRVATSATLSSIFALGEVMLGGIAWLIQPWRYMLMALHIPGFLIIIYCGVLSESVRWLLSKRKFSEARKVLENVARINRTQISEKSLEALMIIPKPSIYQKDGQPNLFNSILKSPKLLRRVCTTPVWWITTIFVYYGLSINSAHLSDTMYLNFILTCIIEIPGFYTAVLVMDRTGRKVTLSSGFFFSAICNIAFVLVPYILDRQHVITEIVDNPGKNRPCVSRTYMPKTLLIGSVKPISMVMTSLYLYTSELYPTEYRHSLLAFSSMIGRIGAITAPLTPVLTTYWHGIPCMMFGVMGVLSGLLVLTQPETLGTKMPDTLAEAEALGEKPQVNPERTL